MFSHLYASPNQQLLPFPEYIKRCRTLIEERRVDLQGKAPEDIEHIINTNAPYELKPVGRPKYGALLIHGLLNCPFVMKEVGASLQAQGVLTRSILLPGHGTRPEDLLHVTYQDWIQSVLYGINSLRQEVDHVYLVGYSTGAALSVHQALLDEQITGLILLSPAIKIKAPVDLLIGWRRLVKLLTKNKLWVYRDKEVDYAKYQSIPFNAVTQVSLLAKKIETLIAAKPVTCPIFMAMSHEDETISSHTATNFFKRMSNPRSELLLYSATMQTPQDSRINIRLTENNALRIKDFSHLSILFSPINPHYGLAGDYIYASNHNKENILYGAYNSVEIDTYNLLYQLGLTKLKRQELTYNPDFDFMAEKIKAFVLSTTKST